MNRRALLLALVAIRLETLAVFVLAHLLTTLFDQRTHSGDPSLENQDVRAEHPSSGGRTRYPQDTSICCAATPCTSPHLPQTRSGCPGGGPCAHDGTVSLTDAASHRNFRYPQVRDSIGTPVRAYMVFHTYTDSVIAAGGMPIMLLPVEEDHLDQALDQVDGLMLAGGGDVAPERYGAPRHETVGDVDDKRDQLEIELVRRAHDRRLPTMAICRGLQIVNVAFGGTLIQDLPSHTGAVGHNIIGDGAYEPHSIARIEHDCRIARIIGAGDHGVNSIHHQAVGESAKACAVVGSAPDGTVEAIEHEDSDWPMVAVQSAP